ncbi:alanine dehydrogenase [Sphingobacterium spiritivorum]|uniref:alanine dehydrogenase n=2 Tax=Sphingobacterium spiritivorum TaxID=258 RepID=D7VHT1_SPHSI|nr:MULTISPECIES: alanine dehydrogenase [Sphingobacterium]EFK59633.1 putative alanine dehydrogenase [Sphingobacterium spiritivorum ATCC 33861]QQT27928.1 alanine dehydrogenase [Sphingobacterium spiritivorum]QQT37709.1 alanine dehydrogenase [Sphingobacterium spiritivorum]WQD34512.1 alanine dehydrogenase [Sphingobacterium spiritivorum]SUI97495.1 Alanine dehydrogenase 2 [Sphingobacterium spiritivorum]
MGSISKIAQQAMMQPQEALMAVGKSKNSLTIGIPKEVSFQENRIALTPLSVALLIENGHKVILESNAGAGSNFLDQHYSEQGALIVYSSEEVYKADLIIKVASPTLEEVSLMKTGQVLFSSQQPSMMDLAVLQSLIKKKVTALSYEYLQDEGCHLTVVRAMSEIVGATAVLIAAEYLSNVFDGKGLMLGGVTGVPPTEMVIIGAGTVGEFAARTAIALGAQVKVFDSSVYRLRRLQNNVGSRVFTSVIQPIVLNKAVRSCDVVIGALRAVNGRSPCIISEETVSQMKPNSVLIDVSIDQGGCFETSEVTSHDKPVFRKYDVIHYCVPNIASRVARTATYALTNIFSPILLQIGEAGGMNKMIWANQGIRSAIYLYQGNLTNKDMANKFNLPAKDLDLIIVSNL